VSVTIGVEERVGNKKKAKVHVWSPIFQKVAILAPYKKNDKSDPLCLGKYALLTPNIREI